MESNLIEVCGLWEGETKAGKRYWSGSLGGVKVLVFENDKRGNDKAPSHRIFVAKIEKRPAPKVGDEMPF